ncbi:MAG: DUF2157 domain-containing protein [Clostridia bacterium]|nr:DUF2157 domain-containing protein [Clostridia bacterium]
MVESTKKLSPKWVNQLDQEVKVWQQEGIINETQAGAILSRYNNLRQKDEGGRLVTILAIIGAILLGAGVIMFFAANWQAMAKGLKVAIVLGSVIIAYAAGYYLTFEKQNYPRVGRALIFLGTVLYGAGIWLIAQIFHISSHYPNGVLFWFLGIIPVVLVCRSLSVLIEVSLLLTLWTVLEQTGFENYNWLYLPLLAVILGLGYYIKSRVATGLTLAGTVFWMVLGGFVSFKGISEIQGIWFVFLLVMVLGWLIYSMGNLQGMMEKFSFMKISFQIVGLLAFFLFLFLATFEWFVPDFYSYYGTERNFNYSGFFMVTYGLAALGATGSGLWVLLKGKGDSSYRREGLLILTVSIILMGLAFLAPWLSKGEYLAIANLLLFAVIVTVIVMGYYNKEAVLINFGLVFFVLDIIARYFDFFWDMLPKSVFFMAGGLLLLGGGFLLERNRRKIIREMRVMNHEV